MPASHAALASTRPHWTPAGTLLLPIAPQALPLPAPALELDGIALRRKRELHATIVGNALGARMRKARGEDPAVGAAVDAAIANLAWTWQRCRHWTLLEKRGEAPCRHALVERIELPAMAAFHRRLGDALRERLPVPPPHVTLYTAPDGKGIGIPDTATLARLRLRDVDAAELAGVLP